MREAMRGVGSRSNVSCVMTVIPQQTEKTPTPTTAGSPSSTSMLTEPNSTVSTMPASKTKTKYRSKLLRDNQQDFSNSETRAASPRAARRQMTSALALEVPGAAKAPPAAAPQPLEEPVEEAATPVLQQPPAEASLGFITAHDSLHDDSNSSAYASVSSSTPASADASPKPAAQEVVPTTTTAAEAACQLSTDTQTLATLATLPAALSSEVPEVVPTATSNATSTSSMINEAPAPAANAAVTSGISHAVAAPEVPVSKAANPAAAAVMSGVGSFSCVGHYLDLLARVYTYPVYLAAGVAVGLTTGIMSHLPHSTNKAAK